MSKVFAVMGGLLLALMAIGLVALPASARVSPCCYSDSISASIGNGAVTAIVKNYDFGVTSVVFVATEPNGHVITSAVTSFTLIQAGWQYTTTFPDMAGTWYITAQVWSGSTLYQTLVVVING